MIQVTKIIDYMRPLLPNLRIDGAAALANAKDDSRLMMENGVNFITTLFVMLGDFSATTLANETFLQDYDERIVFIACIDNTLDRTGKYAQQFVYQLRLALFGILLNYKYDPASHSLQYVGDKMMDMDRSRYWHKFEFRLLGRLDETDGVGIDLTDFNEYTATWQSPDPLADEPIASDDIKGLYDSTPTTLEN